MFRTLLASLCLLLASCAPPEQRGPVVLAASSMTEAVEAAADAWAAQGHDRPVLSFAGSAAVARQVEQGAPADLVIVADAEWMDWLERQQLVDTASRRDIASNSLVFVWQGDVPDHLARPRQIAMADPDSVPAGRYGRAAMEDAGTWESAKGKVVPTENVRQALALVQRGEADLGVVYATDAREAPELRTQPLPLPDGVEVLYPAAVIRASPNAEARDFLDFLASPAGAAIFCAHGFTMPEGRQQC